MDQNCTSSERAQYACLKRKLSDANFVLNVGLMLDALAELEHLSLKLQDRNNVTLPEAHHLNFSEISCVSVSDSKPRGIL
jgi:hypothetical protein